MSRLIIIDGSNLARRAFHAGGNGGVAGAARKARELVGEGASVVVAWDGPPPTWRHRLWPQYKAHREHNPEALRAVRQEFKECAAAKLPGILARDGEADDAAATLALRSAEDGRAVYLLSSDKDWGQLIRPGVYWLVPDKGRLDERSADWFGDKFGVAPEDWPDYVGLAGDATDGIPGVQGIGPVKARRLLAEYGSLEQAIECLELPDVERDAAVMSKRLAQLKTDSVLDWH